MEFYLGKRLGQERVGTNFQGGIFGFDVDAGDHDDFDVGIVLFEEADEVYAEAVREAVVQQDEGGLVLCQEFSCFGESLYVVYLHLFTIQ